jgi:hypothetical protein
LEKLRDAEQGSHPLAGRLAARLAASGIHGPILEVAKGSGRNTRALEALGFEVVSLDDAAPYTQLPSRKGGYAAAISTHAYLHGNFAKIRAGIAELRRVLAPGAPVALVFGSIHDERFGFGTRVDDMTFAPGDGPEAGVPHAFLDSDAVEQALSGFTIEALDEVDVDDIVGRWAHGDDEITGRKHWFVLAHKAADAVA